MPKSAPKTTKIESPARTQVCFLLDETQSMLARKDETIKGFNGYIEELKKDKGDEVLFTLTTFNRGDIRPLYKAEPIKNVKPLTDKTYQSQNWTPLFDAIGTTICALEKATHKEDLIIFTILTDGEENSSQEYTQQAIKDLIAKHEKGGWKFTYLGVGVDAFKGGATIGVAHAGSFNVGASGGATQALYSSMSVGTNAMRGTFAAQGMNAVKNMSVLSDKDRNKLKDQ